MKLREVHVKEFKSVRDATPFAVNDITCLVGKNEAGKTAILEALYRLNPIVPGAARFDVTDDYPRADVEDYRHAVESKKRTPAVPILATFELEPTDLTGLIAAFGGEALTNRKLIIYKAYGQEGYYYRLTTNDAAAFKFLISRAKLTADVAAKLAAVSGVDALLNALGEAEATEEVERLKGVLAEIKTLGTLSAYFYKHYISQFIPRFLYFSEYFQLSGYENLDALIKRRDEKTLKDSDHPLLGLIALARLRMDELLNPDRTQELKNRLEGAGNQLTKQVLKYWSQNKHLRMMFDVRPARPQDPEGMRSGTNIWAEVYDQVHLATTGLSTRSRGFVWFFSFLAWYSGLRESNIILLLDEPGLSLHAKAQADLLRYFEEGKAPHHQLIYSTHSPFMVDPTHFDRIRIVQDRSIDIDDLPPDQVGTKVLTDVLEANDDSLFPLQGALGYEIHQTLFIGPNCLIVEGVSDLLYLQTISGLLSAKGRVALSPAWTITPVGGSDKVPTFVALIGSQKKLKLATLIDFQKKDQQSIENLYKKKLLAKSHVLTFADFTGQSEADVEDMFDPDFYVRLVNDEYKKELSKKVKVADLGPHPRITVRLETYFGENPMKGNAAYNHFRPARYFAEQSSTLDKAISDATLDRFENAFKALNALLPKSKE